MKTKITAILLGLTALASGECEMEKQFVAYLSADAKVTQNSLKTCQTKLDSATAEVKECT